MKSTRSAKSKTKSKPKPPIKAKKKKISKKQSNVVLPIVTFALGLLGGVIIYQSSEKSNTPSRPQFERNTISMSSTAFVDIPSHEIDFPIISPIRKRAGYTVAYDGRNRNPSLVMEILTAESIKGSANREDCQFKADEDIPKHTRADLIDYRGSGYDRGHMAPAADCKNDLKAMEDSFLLTNMCPQDPKFNRGYWSRLESHVRNLTKEYSIVKVFTGPLYLPQEAKDGQRFISYKLIGKNDVAVPTHFFKVLSMQKENGEFGSAAYILPNQAIESTTPLDQFKVTLEKVERVSGIIFPGL